MTDSLLQLPEVEAAGRCTPKLLNDLRSTRTSLLQATKSHVLLVSPKAEQQTTTAASLSAWRVIGHLLKAFECSGTQPLHLRTSKTTDPNVTGSRTPRSSSCPVRPIRGASPSAPSCSSWKSFCRSSPPPRWASLKVTRFSPHTVELGTGH
jgi:hypothetical protein